MTNDEQDQQYSVSETDEQFSVCQFFETGGYEYVRRFVTAEEALKAFTHYTSCVTATMGITTRVIITDGGDCINMEWKYGEGLIYPPMPSKLIP